MDYQNNPNGEQFNQNTLNNTAAPQQPVYQQPTEQPVYQQPVYQQPVYQQPVYQQPVYQQPVQPAPQGGGKGLGIASLIVSGIATLLMIIGLATAATATWFDDLTAATAEVTFSLILALVGLGLGIPGIIVAKKRGSTIGLALTGLILSGVLLLIALIAIAAL